MKPKDIGTRAETMVVNWVRTRGFGTAERMALHGTQDTGDIRLCPTVIIEVKAGAAANNASDKQIETWLDDTDRERAAGNADIGVLVTQRPRHGAARVGSWWAWTRVDTLADLRFGIREGDSYWGPDQPPVRIHLDAMLRILRWSGHGDPLPDGGDLT
jgi:hypothetical protein